MKNSRCRVIAVANQKGGVGKTTTAHTTVTGLKLRGYKTLAIDTDPQCNLTFSMAADENSNGVYQILSKAVNPRDCIQAMAQGDIIASSLFLSGADMEFTNIGREYILLENLKELREIYDFIVIDTPPTLGIITINALTAAQDLIIPVSADTFSLQGLSQISETIKMIRKHCNPNLNLSGLLITRHNRTILARDFLDTIKNKVAPAIGANVFKTIIREAVPIKESQANQESLFSYAPKSGVSEDYHNYITEYLTLKGVMQNVK